MWMMTATETTAFITVVTLMVALAMLTAAG